MDVKRLPPNHIALAATGALSPRAATIATDGSTVPLLPALHDIPLPFELKMEHAVAGGCISGARHHIPVGLGDSSLCKYRRTKVEQENIGEGSGHAIRSISDCPSHPTVSFRSPIHKQPRRVTVPSALSLLSPGALHLGQDEATTCLSTDLCFSNTGFALMLANLPRTLQIQGIFDLLSSFGIAKAQATVRMPLIGENKGHCWVYFFDKADALHFAERASDHPFPKSRKRLSIRPTVMQNIRHFAMPIRPFGDHVKNDRAWKALDCHKPRVLSACARQEGRQAEQCPRQDDHIRRVPKHSVGKSFFEGELNQRVALRAQLIRSIIVSVLLSTMLFSDGPIIWTAQSPERPVIRAALSTERTDALVARKAGH